MKYVSKEIVKEICGGCSQKETKTSKKGNEYEFCNDYGIPCFSVCEQCRESSIALENKAINEIEKGIVDSETDFGDREEF